MRGTLTERARPLPRDDCHHVSVERRLLAGRVVLTNLCISDAEVLMPRHSNNMTPARATHSRKRVLVTKIHTARAGGSLRRAACQLMPPLGSIMDCCILRGWAGRSAPPDRSGRLVSVRGWPNASIRRVVGSGRRELSRSSPLGGQVVAGFRRGRCGVDDFPPGEEFNGGLRL